MSTFGCLNDGEFEDLKNVFYSQAYEAVENLQDLLLALEAAPGDGATLKAIKRHVHTLKGDSNSIGLTSLGALCHGIEDVLSSLIDGPENVKHDCIDLLLGGVDLMSAILAESEVGTAPTETDDFMKRIDAFLRRDLSHGGEGAPSVVPGALHEGAHGRCGQQEPPLEPRLTEYQELQLRDAVEHGAAVYELQMVFHPLCADRASGAFMAIQRLNTLGQVIRSLPDVQDAAIEKAEKMTVLLCTERGMEEIRKDAFIAGITAEVQAGGWSLGAGNRHQASAHSAPWRGGPEGTSPGPAAPALTARGGILRIEASRVDKIMELTGELIIGRSMIEQVARDLEDGASKDDIAGRLLAANAYMERTVADLQKGMMKIRMVPISHVFRKFPKIVRDLCAEKGKLARLEVRGKETELDKGVVDALGEPLAHIFRNFIDHGIEDPGHRRSIGKPEEGVIRLNACHEAGQIVIEASDDGRGIDRERLRRRAAEKGLLTAEEAEKLTDREAVNLIFLSGLSTAEAVSETSGRGVGMEAVKSALDAMKGSIEVESTPEQGTLFRLRLPLTLAVIRALLFEVGGKLYAIPVSAVTDVARIMTHDLVTVDGKDTFLLRDRIISVIRLHRLFNTPEGDGRKFILIIGLGNRKMGLLVDRIQGQQELVIKAVEDWYMKSGLLTGASILGDGRVVLIIDAPALFGKAVDDERKRTVTA